MKKSARTLGAKYGLSAQEMNYILKEQGFLTGEAGDYAVTEKGKPYSEEQDFHRGTGGYATYNRYWTTRSWDESIEDTLDITDEVKANAKAAVAEVRRQQREQIKAARAAADAAFLAHYNNKEHSDIKENEPTENNTNPLANGLIIGGLVVLGYGVYKATPHIKNWWRKSIFFKPSRHKMPCPACNAAMLFNKPLRIWECNHCHYSISEKALLDGEIFWFCDNCGTFLNTQEGFTTKESHWTCTLCEFDNVVDDTAIID